MNSKKIKDPFQFFDDQSTLPSSEDVKKQREKYRKLVDETDVGLTAKIKKDLDEKKKHRNKIKKICDVNNIGLTAEIRMGIEQQLETKEEENLADKYGYEEETKDTTTRNSWDIISPTAHIKRTLGKKWQNSDDLGLTEKIARSILTHDVGDGEVEIKASVFWDLFIFVFAITLTITLAFGIILVLEKFL